MEAMSQEESVVIPPEIVRFLEGASVGFAGTRNRNMMPRAHRLTGWTVGPDRQTLTCMVPKHFLKDLITSLEDNGQFAVTITGSTTGLHRSNPPNPRADAHETYQFKGNYVSSRPVTEEDLKVHRMVRDRFAKLFAAMLGGTEEVVGRFIVKPDLAVTFRVREIYTQTPGPNAGRRLVPPPEAK